MVVVNGYCTTDELSSYIASANNKSSVPRDFREDTFADVVNAASRGIDATCRRVFYPHNGAATSRVFAAASSTRVRIDDATTITAVETDPTCNGTFSQTWTAGDYETDPPNGVVDGQPGWPITRIRAVGSICFPRAEDRYLVRVTAEWGWAAIPDQVHHACLLQANRLLKRIESPEGVAGFGEFGQIRISRVDPDIEMMLSSYIKGEAIG